MKSKDWLMIVCLGSLWGSSFFFIELLLEIYKADRDWNNEAAKNQLTQIFESLGQESNLAINGRRKLSSLMFA